MDILIPPGSLWRVKRVHSKYLHQTFEPLFLSPQPNAWWKLEGYAGAMPTQNLPADTIFMVGTTQAPPPPNGLGEWVEVLTPTWGWANRTHFNRDSNLLERVA